MDDDGVIVCSARSDEVRQQILDLRCESRFLLLSFFFGHDRHAAPPFFFGAV